jgi:hypothetical protein
MSDKIEKKVEQESAEVGPVPTIASLKIHSDFIIGIRREDKSVWERRAPLSPGHIKEILANNP